MPEKGKFNYQDWYEENKEEVSRRRQEKYETNPEYREKAIARARYYYWTKKRKNEITKEVDMDEVELKSDKLLRIDINNPNDRRYGQSIEVPVYDAGQLGRYMERSAQTIRLWERRGVIPHAFWRDGRGYRLYTEDQVVAFLEHRHMLDLPMKNIEDSVFAREIKRALAEMPDGVKVEEAKRVTVSGECSRCSSLVEKDVFDYEAASVRCEKCGGILKKPNVRAN